MASTWTVRQLGGEAAQATLFGISCPGAQLCVAVTFEGMIYTATDPTGPAAAWAVTDLSPEGPNVHIYGVSCPTASFCVASAGGGKILTSTNPTGGPGAWSVTQLAEPLELRGVSCSSPGFCVVVGARGGIRPENEDAGQILSSTNPLAGAWQQVEPSGTEGGFFGVSCPGTTLCVSGDALGHLLISGNPSGGPSAWRTAPGGAPVQITGASCPSLSRCAVVDNNGDVITVAEPAAKPGSWTLVNVAPYPGIDETAPNGMFGVSCPSTGFCAIAGTHGQIFTNTDPFAEYAEPVKKKSTRHRKRPKRPRTTIARGPEPGTEIHGHATKALFRFFANHHAQVRGFVCKIDKRPLRRCRSPKGYRVGIGRHVFRVRAIGWTGLKGPAASYRFKVCHPTPYPDCIRHLPPPVHRERPSALAAAAAPPSLHFQLPASNGYTFQVKTQGSRTLVSLWRGGKVAKTSATYYAFGSAGPDTIDADLGAVGRIDVQFVPSGQTRTVTIRPPRADSDCLQPQRVTRELGTFTGTISFHGEDGYSTVEAVAAEGSVGPELTSRCRRHARHPLHEGPQNVERVSIEENAFLFAHQPDTDATAGPTLLLVSTSSRRARYFVDKIEVVRPGLSIERGARAIAPRSSFTYEGDLSSATLRPPSPFSGEATYSQKLHQLSGNLTVSLPGIPAQPLTGRDFEAGIDPTR